MKYNININQIKCIEYGLNLQQGAIIDLIGYAPIWAEGKDFDGEIYYYLSAGKLIEEYPIITDKKNTVLGIMKKIFDKGIIDRKIIDNKSYYKLTDIGIDFFKESVEKNQEGCGKKSRDGVEKNQDNNITSHNSTNNKKKINKKEKITVEQASELYNHYKDLAGANLLARYRYEDETIEYLLEIGKEYCFEQLKDSIDNYFSVVESKFIMSPKYFFGNKKNGKRYREFRNWLEKPQQSEKPKIKIY